jgi:hypothetical protein
MENVSNNAVCFSIDNTGDLKYYTENDDNVIECIIINDKFEKKVFYKRPMKHSEKDIDKIAELGYN